MEKLRTKKSWTNEEAEQFVRKYQAQTSQHEDDDDDDSSLTKEDRAELLRIARAFKLPQTPDELISSVELFKDDKALSLFFANLGGKKLHLSLIKSADVELVACNDMGAKTGPLGNELVYSVFRDDKQKRFIVAFRGSKSLSDWCHDARVNMVEAPAKDSGQIHMGFDEYLFQASDNNATSIPKYDEVITKLKQLLKEYPNYSTVFTGHSLGKFRWAYLL